jgi:anaerobic magnesium-protoporphyrin IX monomethyl ester cyclase
LKALVLNLPHAVRIYRSYRCSTNSPGFCLPPLELLYQAAVLRDSGAETHFIDAPADLKSLETVIEEVRRIGPDLIVSILGYEHFTDDVDAVNAIIAQTGVPHYAVMGYLPTHFCSEALEHLAADMVLLGEPEGTLADVASAIAEGRPLAGIPGLAVRENGAVHIGPERPRLTGEQLEALPLPARDLLNVSLYREPFLGKLFTTFQAGRGCPYGCVYCTSTYGAEYRLRSPEHVVDEIEDARQRFGVTHFRFIDDTFGISLPWTRRFCRRLVATRNQYRWVALTRVDLMDRERMRLMRRAGCRRLYVGIESGSQKALDFYRKRFRVEDVPRMIANARREGIEVVGYFVVGSPVEDEADYQKTLELARRLQLDMLSVYPMMPYPETTSYAESAGEVDFQLYPFSLEYRDEQFRQIGQRRMRDMMTKVYLSPRFLLPKVKWLIRYPGPSAEAGGAFFGWLLTRFTGRSRKTLI